MRCNSLAMAGLLLAVLATASPATSGTNTYYAVDVRGGSRLFAADHPVRKGRVVLFHRYPDGAYLSLPASEVVSFHPLDVPPAGKTDDRLAPGATVFVGPALDGPRYEMPSQAPDMVVSPGYSDGYGYGYDYGYGYGWGGGGYVPPSRPPGPAPPSRIGPNGFPIIAPPGTAGSQPPPIGSNGYPILAPNPVVVPVPLTRRPGA